MKGNQAPYQCNSKDEQISRKQNHQKEYVESKRAQAKRIKASKLKCKLGDILQPGRMGLKGARRQITSESEEDQQVSIP